jgi:hypothetical protein
LTSNAGASAAYWLAFELSDEQDVTQQSLPNVIDMLKSNQTRSANYGDSTELVNAFIGDPGNQIVITHLSLLQQQIVAGTLTGVTIVYPNPTPKVTHPAYAYSENAQILLTFLTENPEIQKIAWERYGLRPAKDKITTKVGEDLQRYGIVNEVQSTVESPSKAVLDLIKNCYR